MTAHPILIIGAGPTGLVLALRLAHHGVAFRIVDRNAGPGLASRAMAVHARTLEFYQQHGFADEMVSKGVKMETMHLREDEHEVATITLKDIGETLSPFPFVLCFPQDDHERFLVEKLKASGITVEWATTLESFTQDEDGVRAVLDKGGAKETVECAYLCGCDGAHSSVRHGLDLGFGGGAYEHHYYVADVRLEGGGDEDGTIAVGRDAIALRLPVRSSGMKRLIGMAPASLDDREGITFEDVRATAEGLLDCRVAEVNWFSTYRVHHRVAAHFRVGRCFLSGDAGHLHSPTGGQGMNTGIGDAVNLSWKLAHVIKGRLSPGALDSYEIERIAFARSLVATTDEAFRLLVSGGLGGRLLRSFFLPHILPFLTGFSTARQIIFKTVSQTRINYEQSPLSVGKAGDVRGGDRLPWIADRSDDNFAPLRAIDWQLHIYGEAADAPVMEGLPQHRFAWSDAAQRAGFQQGATYLIRPDGYVALALPTADVNAIARYAKKHGLDFGPEKAL